jgi:DNA polymerase III alpha subunit
MNMMKFERLEFDDVAALYIGLHCRSSLDRYMTAREHPIVHQVTEANVILSRTYGVLLYIEDLQEILVLAGMNPRDAKKFRMYTYLRDSDRANLREKFVGGIMNLGYSRNDAFMFFEYVAYTACDTFRRDGVAANVRKFIRTMA